MDAFAVEQQGNAQTGLLHRPALQRIAHLGAEGADDADAVAMELFLGLLQRELPVASFAFHYIGRAELVGLHDKFVQGHAADKIIQPRFDVKLGILIRQHILFLLFFCEFILS